MSERISASSSSSQSTGLPANFSMMFLKNFIGVRHPERKPRDPAARALRFRNGILRRRFAPLRMTVICLLMLHRLARRSRQLLPDSVKNPVDETSRFCPTEFFREFDRFVNGDNGWNVIAKQHFINGQTQNVAINRGDSTKLVILGIS